MQTDIQEKLEIRQHSNPSKKKFYFMALILLLVLAGIYYVLVINAQDKNAQNLQYVTKAIQKDDLTVLVSTTGNLEPTNSVDIGIEVSGTIQEIYVDFNDTVKENQILAKLDTKKLENEVLSLQATFEVAKANLYESLLTVKNTKNKLDRAKKMLQDSKGKYPSQEEMDTYEYNYTIANASYNANKAKQKQALYDLKTAQENLEKATVRSSINGIVLNRNIEIGQTVTATMETPVLFTVAKDLSKMELIVSIDEADIADIKEGLQVVFSVDAYPDTKFYGTIKQLRINPIEVSGVITYDTVVRVDNNQLLLKPGMTATADIITKTITGHLVLPNAALRFTPKTTTKQEVSLKLGPPTSKNNTTDLSKKDERSIWILKDSKPVKVMVKVLESDGKYTAVESEELNEQDQVIVSQQNNNE